MKNKNRRNTGGIKPFSEKSFAPSKIDEILFNLSKTNIRNIKFYGGDAMMDIDCYAIVDNLPFPVSIIDAVSNQKVVDAVFRLAETDRWEKLK